MTFFMIQLYICIDYCQSTENRYKRCEYDNKLKVWRPHAALFGLFCSSLAVLQPIQDRTGITAVIGVRVDDDYMDFLIVASQKLAGVIGSMLWCVGDCVLRSKSVEGISLFPKMGSNLHPSHQRL
jgi:hypothetical protein